jgi:hypothetical protein
MFKLKMLVMGAALAIVPVALVSADPAACRAPDSYPACWVSPADAGPQRHIGGYSYTPSDVTRSGIGAEPAPYPGARQSQGGPFDSGFFFDSGIGPRGGNAPYLN